MRLANPFFLPLAVLMAADRPLPDLVSIQRKFPLQTVTFSLKEATKLSLGYRYGSYIDESTAWIGLNRTFDGGKTWITATPSDDLRGVFSNPLDHSYAHTAFISGATGWLSSTGDPDGVWQTVDGGRTWRLLFEGAMGPVAFLDAKTGWMVLRRKGEWRMYRTRDAVQHGLHAATQPMRATRILFSLALYPLR
jgi:hypothetical protein